MILVTTLAMSSCSAHFSADVLVSSGIKSENFLTLLFRHVLLQVSNVDWNFKLIELYVYICIWFLPVFVVVNC